MNQYRQSQNTSAANTASTTRLLIIAVALLILLLGGFYIWSNRQAADVVAPEPVAIDRSTAPVTETPVEVQEATVPVEEAPIVDSNPPKPIIAPPLSIESSDATVKLAIADLAPAMAAWMVSDQQIRKWVLAIDLMADGDVAKSYRPIAYPLARFEPEVRGVEPEQQFLVKTDSYKRTDLFVSAVVAIDPAHLAQYYKGWLPLLEKAYQDQGKKDKFDQRFRAALQRVLDVKPLVSTPELKKRGGVIYVYADEKLEAATDVEKMMWRMGPDNSLKLQNYLRQLQMRLPK
jgi:hypothetical protein